MAWTLFVMATRFLTEGWIIGGIWGGEVKDNEQRVAYWLVHPNSERDT